MAEKPEKKRKNFLNFAGKAIMNSDVTSLYSLLLSPGFRDFIQHKYAGVDREYRHWSFELIMRAANKLTIEVRDIKILTPEEIALIWVTDRIKELP